MAHKQKCFRCNERTMEGLYITVARRGSVVDSQTHPLCSSCAVDFWKWIDEVGTIVAYQSLAEMKESLRKKEERAKKILAEVRKREKRLIKRAGNKKVEVLARIR